MAKSILRTGPSLSLRVSYTGGDEKTIGYAESINFSVSQGQKKIYTVDTPFAQEISQGAGASGVTGSVVLYMPKGSDPVRAGLVPSAVDFGLSADQPLLVTSKYFNWRFYDRLSGELAFAINFVKVSNWSAVVTAKSVVKVNMTFDGIFYEPGTS
jgi:hypothetical protein